ncbi:RNA helicase, partial [Sarracenia purpurea var. burkii]
ENTAINFDAYEDILVQTSGDNVAPPVNTFAEIDLDEELNQNIRRCKYVKPTPVQRHTIPISLSGTGFDCVCPDKIHEEAQKFAYQTDVKVVTTYGGAPINQQLFGTCCLYEVFDAWIFPLHILICF